MKNRNQLQTQIKNINYKINTIYINFKDLNKLNISSLLVGYFYISATQIFLFLDQKEQNRLTMFLMPINYYLSKHSLFSFFLFFPKKSFLFFQQLIESINFIKILFNWNSLMNEKERKNTIILIYRIIINFYFTYKLFKRGILLGIFIEAFKLGS
uniref:Uncharacterized protein n=1 Tax=Prototheca wickerhamii TaxID=3111 RepID=A0A873HW48_PROWI|nr:hypothetical protein J6669_pgp05 [Prototheca wickerhamii]QOZ41709.1 hypothetical protein DBVPGpl_049 [Prototheca wickerhamii]